MTLALVNVLLALAWAAITESFSLLNLLFGFALGIAFLFLVRERVGTIGYLERCRKILSLAGLFLYELCASGIRVLIMVLKPKLGIQPGIIAYPLDVDRDFEITLLANLITLTPGTLSVDVSTDRKTLYVHALDCSDPEGIKNDIKNGFERKIMEAFR